MFDNPALFARVDLMKDRAFYLESANDWAGAAAHAHRVAAFTFERGHMYAHNDGWREMMAELQEDCRWRAGRAVAARLLFLEAEQALRDQIREATE